VKKNKRDGRLSDRQISSIARRIAAGKITTIAQVHAAIDRAVAK
jgi:hypothetical protein